jgi:hypothetical protein
MVALANWWKSPTSPSIGELSTPLAGKLTQRQSFWLVDKISWFSLGFDGFGRMEDINAEHESSFRLHCDTGLIYPVQRSRDLVWKTTLDISLNIRMTSHRNGGSLCQIFLKWLGFCMQIAYTSQNFTLKSAWTSPTILLAFCLEARVPLLS